MNIVPTDSPSIYAALSTLQMQGARLALVRPNNPPPGIAGFLLDLPGDDGSELESDITDHFTEQNFAIQDHIALRPEVVTVTGEVAELVRAVPTPVAITAAQNPLPLLPDMEPEFTPGAQDEMDEEAQTTFDTQAGIVVDQSLYGYYLSQSPQQPNETKQSRAYGYFYQLWLGRQLFTVETPWGVFTNMAILSLSSKQSAITRSVTEFRITFKKIRVAQSIVIHAGQLAGRAIDQQAAITQSGVAGAAPVTTGQANQFLKQAAVFNGP